MSQRRPSNVLSFPKSKPSEPSSPRTKLNSIRCRMLRSDLPKSPPIAGKAARLQQLRPDVAVVIEKLVDDLLAEVS